MAGTVVLIDHPLGQRDDRAARLLAERGYELLWVCPGNGDALPEPDAAHAGAIVYGGVESANDDRERPYLRAELDWIERWLETGKPYLGFCLGGQLLARVLGASIVGHPEGHYEIGYVPAAATAEGDGFLDGVSHVYHWHTEGFEVPRAATLLATGPVFPNQAFRYGGTAYGLQFHPEVTVPVMRRWLSAAAQMLDNPNAHPAACQIADAEVHDPRMAAWLDRFLVHWLGAGG